MSMKWRTAYSSSLHKLAPIGTIVLLCASLALVNGCALLPKEAAVEPLPTINPPKLSAKPEYPVHVGTLETKVRGVGKIMATKEQDLFFTDDGKRIKQVDVRTGDAVQQGQLIAELDVSDEESQLRQLQLQSRKDELNMIAILRNTDSKSSDEIEQAKIDFQLKQENLHKLEDEIARAKITAPFAGTIAAVYVKNGDTVKAYDTAAVLADLSELTVAVSLSADDLKKVAVGMEASVDINGAGTQTGKVVQLPNPKPAQSGGAGVSYDRFGNPVGGAAQQDSLDNYVLIKLDKMPPGVARGTPLSASITVLKKENALTIPQAALRSITGRYYVVVDDQGTKKEVDVEIGQMTSTEVEIVKGLTPGQKVVGR